MIGGENYPSEEAIVTSPDFLFRAVLDAVFEIGGSVLVAQVREASKNDKEFPSTAALQFLEMKSPGISAKVFDRAAEIQQEIEMEPPNIQQAG